MSGSAEQPRELHPNRVECAARLTPVYDRLRRAAQGQLDRAPDERTLQATALVHEAYLKLAQGGHSLPDDPEYLLALFIRTMRHIVLDAHRKRARARHGLGIRPASLEVVAPPQDSSFSSLDDLDPEALRAALERFEREEPGELHKLQALELSIFHGFTTEQAAEILGVDVRTVQRYTKAARAWLYNALAQGK